MAVKAHARQMGVFFVVQPVEVLEQLVNVSEQGALFDGNGEPVAKIQVLRSRMTGNLHVRFCSGGRSLPAPAYRNLGALPSLPP